MMHIHYFLHCPEDNLCRPTVETGCPSIHSIAEKGCSRKLGFRHTEFSETGGLSMGFRSAERVPFALPTWLFGRGYLALPRADRRAPEVALLLSGVSGSVAPSRKGSPLRHGVRIQDHCFPLPRRGQLDKDRLCCRYLDDRRRCHPVPNRR